MKSVKRFVPEDAFLKIKEKYISDPPLFKHEKDVFYFIMDIIYRLKVYNKNAKYTDDGLLRISSKYFKAYITQNYANYLRWLQKHEILICDKIKKTGKAYGYEVHPTVESKVIPVEIQKSSIITRRIIENYNKRQKFHKKTDSHILTMKKYFKKIMKINTEEALQWLESSFQEKKINIDQYNVYMISVSMIEDGEFYFKTNNTNGRLDTNLTNLKSDLRKFVFMGEYCHIDCKNSQPLILNFILNFILLNSNYKLEITNNPTPSPDPTTIYPSLGEEYREILSKELSNSDIEWLKKFPLNEKIKDEFLNYRDKTFNTDFYNYLKEEYENLYQKVISREEMKELIYKVFFSQNFAYKKEKFLFKEKFPTISQIIYKLKKQRHNKFALCLQRIESEIFIKKICKRLVENDIIPLTIHDSVIVIAKDEEKTLQIVSEVYSEVLHGIPEFECSVL